jgi:hypothetical protein
MRPRVALGCGLAVFMVAGCGGTTAAYQELQSAIRTHITEQDHRPVDSVGCVPHVKGTVREETAHLRCLVLFKDGTSYTANAEIINENSGGAHNLPDRYVWDAPPATGSATTSSPGSASSGAGATTATAPASTAADAADVTRVLPPRPAGVFAGLKASSSRSLFRAANLAPMLRALTRRYGGDVAVVQAAIYPGELDLVVAKPSGALVVRADIAGRVDAGSNHPFAGTRDAVDLAQIKPSVPQSLVTRIAHHGGVPLASIDRMVLDTTAFGNLAGWRISPHTGPVYFRALLTGDGLERHSPSGKRDIG